MGWNGVVYSEARIRNSILLLSQARARDRVARQHSCRAQLAFHLQLYTSFYALMQTEISNMKFVFSVETAKISAAS